MAVPYHTHNFEIPTATKQDMVARASNEKVVTPSVLGTAATADTSEFATAEQGKKADSAIQAENLGTLARKNKVNLAEIETNGIPSSTTFLSGNGWQTLSGGGDMTIAIYDPSHKKADTFDMGNMKEAANAKIMSANEREKIANLDKTYIPRTGGTITGNLDVGQNLKGVRSVTTNGWILIENDGTADVNNYGIRLTVPEKKSDHTAEITMGAAGELRFRMASSPSNYALQCYQNGYVRVQSGLMIGETTTMRTDGNILGSSWINGNLANHIESRCAAFQNACVIDTRQTGWASANSGGGTVNGLPSGYFANGIRHESNGTVTIGGAQLQIYIPNRGWRPMAWW